MKITKLFEIGKSKHLSAVISVLVLFSVVLGCGGGKPETPSEAEAQTLVKATLNDFADAVDKGSFSDFRGKASADFQSQFTADALNTAFKAFIDAKAKAVPILKSAAGMSAKFSATPSIREEKGNYILVTAGTMDTTPAKTRFNFEYVWRDKSWKLIVVKTFLE